MSVWKVTGHYYEPFKKIDAKVYVYADSPEDALAAAKDWRRDLVVRRLILDDAELILDSKSLRADVWKDVTCGGDVFDALARAIGERWPTEANRRL